MEHAVVVLDRSHLDSCVLSQASLESMEFIWVWQLHNHGIDCRVEAGTNHFELFINTQVVVVNFKLLLEVVHKFLLLSICHFRLGEKLINCLTIFRRCIAPFEHFRDYLE